MADLTIHTDDPAPAAEMPQKADLLLSLPTLAQAAFGIIVLTYVGILVAAVAGDGPPLTELIVLALLLLPLRAIMARPDKQRAAREDPAATRALKESGDYDRILREIDALAASEFGYTRPIGLVITRLPNDIQAVASWRRDYLFLGRSAAKRLARGLAKDPVPGSVRTVLVHELAHIAHHDERRVGFAGELLRGSGTILPWGLLFSTFLIGMGAHGIVAALEIDFTNVPGFGPSMGQMINDLLLPDEAQRAEMLARAESIDSFSVLTIVFLSLLPIAAIGGILYLFFWRWMMRLQEHYADIATGRFGSTVKDLRSAMGFSMPLDNSKPSRWRRRNRKLPGHPPQKDAPPPRKSIRDWFELHPTLGEREAVLAAPELLYTDWKRVAWSAVVLSLGLDIIFSSPLVLYHGLPLHLYIATTLLLLSTWLLPQFVLGRSFGRDLARVLLVITVVRLVWLLFNVGLLVVQVIFFPSNALVLLNSMVIAISRYGGELATAPVTDPMMGLTVAFGAVLLELLQLGGLLASVFLYVWWMRRSAVSGSAATIRRRHWVAVVVIIVGIHACLWPLARLIEAL